MSDFFKYKLSLENDLFQDTFQNVFQKLSHQIDFEELGKGRKGSILVNKNNGNIPIVRTTTNYQKPAHIFSDLHNELAQIIKNTVNHTENTQFLELDFNNAMIEIYDQDYTKMGYHSDQCLDLENNSHIALFSCYERPDELLEKHLRKLKIKNKATNEETELLLEHNTVVVFSLKTNTLFQHKIILENTNSKPNLNPKTNPTKNSIIGNNWLGITFRTSKTFIHFKENLPYFSDGNLLEIATENQKKDFFMLKGQENNNVDFVYPHITYTFSESDLMPND